MGTPEVLAAVVNMGKHQTSFKWPFCDTLMGCPSHFDSDGPLATRTVTSGRVGFDAASPLFRYPEDTDFIDNDEYEDEDDPSYIEHEPKAHSIATQVRISRRNSC